MVYVIVSVFSPWYFIYFILLKIFLKEVLKFFLEKLMSIYLYLHPNNFSESCLPQMLIIKDIISIWMLYT